MPKLILFILCWLVSLNGFCKAAGRQEFELNFRLPRPAPADTATIRHEMARQPFLLDTVTLEALRRLIGEGCQVKKVPIKNRFVKNQVDTLITLRKGNSYIRLYAVSKAGQIFYQAAEIIDPLPIFQQSLHIGQSKSEIAALYPELKRYAKIPDLVEIGVEEGTDFLYLIFQKGVLKKVEFKPYLD